MSRIIRLGQKAPLPVQEKRISPLALTLQHKNDTNEKNHSSDEIVQQAKKHAKQIVEQAYKVRDDVANQINNEKLEWETERKMIIQKAEKEGFDTGFSQGKFEAAKHCEQLIKKAQQVVDQSKTAYYDKLEEAESTILHLAIRCAETILGTALGDHPEKFLNVVKRAIKEVRDETEIQIHVHPSKYENLLAAKKELMESFTREVRCYVYPDDELQENDCLIESENGRINASIDSQFIQLKQGLSEILNSEARQ